MSNQDQGIENEVGMDGLSLAQLASLDTTEIRAITSLIPPAGVFRMRGLEVKGGQSQPQEGKPPLFFFNFASEVLGAKLVDKSLDPEQMVGRRITDSFTLWPAQFQDMIGLMKGRYKTIGLPNEGPRLGGVEGQEPGWLDQWTNHEYTVKISHYTDKQGNPRARFAYMKADSDGQESGAAAA